MARRCPRHELLVLRTAALAIALFGTSACAPRGEPVADTVAAGNAERGRKLLAQYQCGACHAIPGIPSAGGDRAPSLQSFGARSYIAGRVVNRPDLLAQWITQPQSLVPGTAMPSMVASPADARDMAAYLWELR
jgi:cytochrome c